MSVTGKRDRAENRVSKCGPPRGRQADVQHRLCRPSAYSTIGERRSAECCTRGEGAPRCVGKTRRPETSSATASRSLVRPQRLKRNPGPARTTVDCLIATFCLVLEDEVTGEVLGKGGDRTRAARSGAGHGHERLRERRALTVVHMSAGALRSMPRPDPDPGLRDRIVALAHRHRR